MLRLMRVGLLVAALGLVGASSASAQSWGTTTTCDPAYDWGVSGFYGSNCRSTNAYAGWGYGGAQVNQYAVGGWWSYPQASAGSAYSPWGYGSYSTVSCRAWGVC